VGESIDPDDLLGPTLALARTNPAAYVYRFGRVRPDVARKWLRTAPAEALRLHSDAMRQATGRGLDIAAHVTVTGTDWHVRAFPDVDERVAPERATERIDAVRELAAAVGVELSLKVDIAADALWNGGAESEAALLERLVSTAIELVSCSPFSDRGEPAEGEWWCCLVADIPALDVRSAGRIAGGRTSSADHDAIVAQARERAAVLAAQLGVVARERPRQA
jgi:hypothetical protein